MHSYTLFLPFDLFLGYLCEPLRSLFPRKTEQTRRCKTHVITERSRAILFGSAESDKRCLRYVAGVVSCSDFGVIMEMFRT